MLALLMTYISNHSTVRIAYASQPFTTFQASWNRQNSLSPQVPLLQLSHDDVGEKLQKVQANEVDLMRTAPEFLPLTPPDACARSPKEYWNRVLALIV